MSVPATGPLKLVVAHDRRVFWPLGLGDISNLVSKEKPRRYIVAVQLGQKMGMQISKLELSKIWPRTVLCAICSRRSMAGD
jgi:hypothetical protein